MLGCVIFFPRLTYVVNQGVRVGAEHPLCCVDCLVQGVAPLYGVRGSALLKLFFGLYIRLGEPTYGFRSTLFMRWFSVHGIGCFGMYIYVL